ncbi:hypothetical protein HPB47_025327 [Ixodes persulcatus]|uniref:Uncharacterized protein n=1 Tax=Ixodes persulcatus TaxID=34615 RepID=A0AC60Q3N6_IXOPE|nr:hypothetical protein HPB47_025327 [Ixodes persulcatus]
MTAAAPRTRRTSAAAATAAWRNALKRRSHNAQRAAAASLYGSATQGGGARAYHLHVKHIFIRHFEDVGRSRISFIPVTAKGCGRKESFSIYIYKVLEQVHPNTGVSSKAMSIMNSFVNNIFERIAAELSRLAHYNKRSITTSRDIWSAVRLLLPG